MSSPPPDEQGLDLFEETASAAGNFPHALRGYDRGAVDAYVREVEAKLSRVLGELRETQYRLALASATLDTTDYSRLGGHARTLLKSAEAQAAELVQQARAEAARIRSQAEVDSTRTTHETQLAMDVSRAAGLADIDQLRQLLGAQTAAELEAAKADAAALREATEQQRDWLLREAETQAKAIIDAAVAEAEQRRAEGERVSAEQAAELARVREATLAEIAVVRQTAVDQVNGLVEAARASAEEQRARLEADLLTADQRREAARAEAAGITGAAAEQARQTVEAARHEAARITAEANQAAEERTSRLDAEIAALSERKQAIVGQLEELSSLAAESTRQAAGAAPETTEPPAASTTP